MARKPPPKLRRQVATSKPIKYATPLTCPHNGHEFGLDVERFRITTPHAASVRCPFCGDATPLPNN